MRFPHDKLESGEARLVSVAARLLAELGPEVSVDHICSEAGYSKGAFYHHFPSKRDLMVRAVAELTRDGPLSTDVLLRLLPLARRDHAVADLLLPQVGSVTNDPAERLRAASALGERLWSRLHAA
jgi:AcrR family transcriptional regulator